MTCSVTCLKAEFVTLASLKVPSGNRNFCPFQKQIQDLFLRFGLGDEDGVVAVPHVPGQVVQVPVQRGANHPGVLDHHGALRGLPHSIGKIFLLAWTQIPDTVVELPTDNSFTISSLFLLSYFGGNSASSPHPVPDVVHDGPAVGEVDRRHRRHRERQRGGGGGHAPSSPLTTTHHQRTVHSLISSEHLCATTVGPQYLEVQY